MANFTALKTAINNAIKTNGNEEITGAILQAILDAMVETLGDSAINDLENAITTEVTNRENAVGDVAADLAAEALARQALDYNVNNRINAEEYNRQNADAALSQTMSQGFQTLGSQMTALNAAISALNAAYQNGYLYGGIATPSSSPSNNKCFYIALQGGTYTNFGGVGVIEGINIIKNDSGWKVEHIYDQTTLLNEFYLLRQQVIRAISSIDPIVIQGDVTNAPDEEDLTSDAQHLLKFKDNAYNPIMFSGMGKKFLRKNIRTLSDPYPFDGFVEDINPQEELSGTPAKIFWDREGERFVGWVDGVYYLAWTDDDAYVPVSTENIYMYDGNPYKWNGEDFYVDDEELPNVRNVLTQSMINEANTIYVIRYDYTLAEDITIPANCVLEFDGGCISGEYTITGNHTIIISENLCLKKDVIIAGTWDNSIIYTKWFEFISADDGVTDNVLQFKQLQNVINGTAGCKVEFEKGYYQTSVVGKTPNGGYVTYEDNTYPWWKTNIEMPDEWVVLNIGNISYIDICLNGSTIKAINIQNPAWSMITTHTDTVYIHDGTLIGMAGIDFDYPQYADWQWDRSDRPNYQTLVRDYEFTYLIYACSHFSEIYNIQTLYSAGDGILCGSEAVWSTERILCEGYVIRDSEIGYCGKNGIVLYSSKKGNLQNLHIHHVGNANTMSIDENGIMAYQPRAGIDVEFEDSNNLKPIMEWRNLYIHDCGAKDVGFAAPDKSSMKSFYATNCTFLSAFRTSNMTADGQMMFENCKFVQGKSEAYLAGTNIIFVNCYFDIQNGLGFASDVLVNCTIVDNSTVSRSFGGNGYNKYIHCNITLNNLIEFLNSQFYGCVIDSNISGIFYVSGSTFTNCEISAKNDLTSNTKGIQFINNPSQIKDFKFDSCTFKNLRKISTGLRGTSFECEAGIIISILNCKFVGDASICNNNKVIIKNCEWESIGCWSGVTDESPHYEIDNCTGTIYTNFLRTHPSDIRNSTLVFQINDPWIPVFNKSNIDTCKITLKSSSNPAAKFQFNLNNSYITTYQAESYSYATDYYNAKNCVFDGTFTEIAYIGENYGCTFVNAISRKGTTADRPTLNADFAGLEYFDTTLGKPIWWDGSAWKDAAGTTV